MKGSNFASTILKARNNYLNCIIESSLITVFYLIHIYAMPISQEIINRNYKRLKIICQTIYVNVDMFIKT